MRTIRIIEHISLDGVIQAPGGPEEDPESGFSHGGWAFPHFDEEVGKAIGLAHPDGSDLLLGRRTYDIFAAHWPGQTDAMADNLNNARKYVATSRPDSLMWGPADGLGANIVERLREIKAGIGPDLIVWGSSTLTPVLIASGLADELVLLVFPVLLGKGKRLFSGTAAATELQLIRSKAAPSGVIISTYKPAGPVRTGSF
ncbi:MAG: dihydrofolate reductase family protein [Caulobacterales bacterium]|uniref:dihydrofolate reductase family protein n=1 Tax=Glycocaulis sp. TaxID=1969725 RepID=UPI003FA07214